MKNPIFIEITHAEYIGGYKMRVHFNNGDCKVVDFYDILFTKNYPVFKPLREINHFREFTVTDTIEWENGTIDIAPETVYEMGVNESTGSVAEPTENYKFAKKTPKT